MGTCGRNPELYHVCPQRTGGSTSRASRDAEAAEASLAWRVLVSAHDSDRS